MKRILPSSLAAGALTLCFSLIGHSGALADWSSDFTKEPYALDETIIGTGGWVGTRVDGHVNDAAIVTAPHSYVGNVLRVISSSTGGDTSRQTRVTNQFTKVEGDKVQLNMALGYEWALPPATPTSRYMTFTLTAEEHLSPISIYYGMSTGIFLNGTYAGFDSGDLQILAADRVKAGALYDFNVVMDFDLKKFDITVTGVDVNDDSFTWFLKDVPFRTGHQANMTGINQVRLQNLQGDRLTMYVRDISVTSIPEPGTVAYLLVGAVAGGVMIAKRRRH